MDNNIISWFLSVLLIISTVKLNDNISFKVHIFFVKLMEIYNHICEVNPLIIDYFDNISFKVHNFFVKLMEIYNHICEVNPLIIDYFDINNNEDISSTNNNTNSIINDTVSDNTVLETKYNNKYYEKYLQKFNNFPNEYPLTNDEKIELEKLFKNTKFNLINEYNEEIATLETESNLINKIYDSKSNINYNVNDNTIMLLSYMEEKHDYEDLIDNYNSVPESVNIDELWDEFIVYKDNIDAKLTKLKSHSNTFDKTDEDIREEAYENIVKKHLKKHMDNYVFETTPLGNVYMRLNIDKNAFEYYSDCTIPYRYLETVGRKYVTTYWCKPFFVDVNEEFKKGILAKDQKQQITGKNYSKETLDVMKTINSKNNSNFTQIKANLPDVNDINPNKHLLKEKSNTYICEGKLQDAPLLKKIDRKIVDKRLNMTFSEFKKMQQQNKK